MKKILLVATVQSHIGQFHKPLMKLLKDKGWEIHVAARNNLAEKNGLELEYPDVIYDIPFQRSPVDVRNLKAHRQLRQLLQSTYYDVIHCNTPVGGVLTRIAARNYRKRGTKVFYTAHGFHFYHGSPLLNWLLYYPLEKWLAGYTDLLITINKEDYELAKHKFSCPVRRIHGVGANSEKYRIINEDERKKLREELALNGHILITVGELLPNKNQKTAVLTLKKVLQSYPDTILLIAGNGPERDNLEKLVTGEGLDRHVRFLGYSTQLQRYLQAADVEIACSYREGLGLNIIEAMLCGKPVVASENRGHREIISSGINGSLVNADDTEAYSAAICRLFSGEAGDSRLIRQSVRIYTDKCVMQELEEIYLRA